MRGLIRGVIVAAIGAGAAFWWWDGYLRSPIAGRDLPPRPSLVKVEAERIDQIFDQSPWVAPTLEDVNGPVLWQLGFRQCSDCLAYDKSEFAALHAAGVETRVVLYAPLQGRYVAPPPEQATLAEMQLRGSWAIFEDWMAVAPAAYYARASHPRVEGDPVREAILKAGRRTRADLEEVMAANGWDMEVPALFWKDAEGRWMVYLGDTERGRRQVRRALGVPLD